MAELFTNFMPQEKVVSSVIATLHHFGWCIPLWIGLSLRVSQD